MPTRNALLLLAAIGLPSAGCRGRATSATSSSCANDLRRVDIDDPAGVDPLWADSTMVTQPMVNPEDANDILFVERDRCGNDIVPRRLDLAGPSLADVADMAGPHPRYQYLRRSADGARFAYAFRQSVRLEL